MQHPTLFGHHLEGLVFMGRVNRDLLKKFEDAQTCGRLLIPKAYFRRLVRDICTENHIDHVLTNEAYDALQTAAEDYLTRIFDKTGGIAVQHNRNTIYKEDIPEAVALEKAQRIAAEDEEMERRHQLEKEHMEWWRREPNIDQWEWEELSEYHIYEKRSTIDHDNYNAWRTEVYDLPSDFAVERFEELDEDEEEPESINADKEESNSSDAGEDMDLDEPLVLACITCKLEMTVAFDCACNHCVQTAMWQCPGCAGQPRLAFCEACTYAVCPAHSMVLDGGLVVCNHVHPVTKTNGCLEQLHADEAQNKCLNK